MIKARNSKNVIGAVSASSCPQRKANQGVSVTIVTRECGMGEFDKNSNPENVRVHQHYIRSTELRWMKLGFCAC